MCIMVYIGKECAIYVLIKRLDAKKFHYLVAIIGIVHEDYYEYKRKICSVLRKVYH